MCVSGRTSVMLNLNSIIFIQCYEFLYPGHHFPIIGQKNENKGKNTVLKIRSLQTNPFIRTQYQFHKRPFIIIPLPSHLLKFCEVEISTISSIYNQHLYQVALQTKAPKLLL